MRVVILTGAGEQAFISGADIGSFAGAPADPGAIASTEPHIRAWRTAVWHFPKSVIAAIRGWCLGGGVSIAMQADIRIAAEALRIGLVHDTVPEAELDAGVRALAQRIAANAPLSLQAMKIGISTPNETGRPQAAVAQCLASDDFLEGRNAFRERRKPVFVAK